MAIQAYKADEADQVQLDEETLVAIGLKRVLFWRRFRKETALAMVYLAMALFIIGMTLSPGEEKQVLQALALIPASISVSLGYIQWRAARHEVSYDRYYDKLDIANKRFDTWRTTVLKDDPEKLHDHLSTMFVFSELDNLEYVLGKYKLGYVGQELAERAIRAFRSRCEESADFCTRALWWVGEKEGQQMAKGYEKTTREAVRHLTNPCVHNDNASSNHLC